MAFRSKLVKPEELADFMAEARRRFSFGLSVDSDDRAEAQEDQRFIAGGLHQWDQASIESRSDLRYPRPILTENRLHVYVQQVVNDGRLARPSIAVSPTDAGTRETAEVIQSWIRQVEYESGADVAYDTSREQQVISGRGWYRVTTEYANPISFSRLVARIRRIENQFSVVWDPSSTLYDKSDADWMFVVSAISKDTYKRKYGDDTELARSGFVLTPDITAWVNIGANGEMIQEAEYWRKKHQTGTLCLLGSGKVAWKDELPSGGQDPLIDPIVDERESDRITIQQFIIDGVGILDETEWIGSYIPLIPVWGREEMLDGKRRTVSLIRHAKEPQRLLNLFVSNMAEQVAQMPKSPYIAAEGQIAGHEDEWEEINITPRGVIQYKPVAIGNVVTGAPARIVNEPPIQALIMGINQSVAAIQAAMGIFDASLGARSNERSGVAIQRRANEADAANYHFHSNEARSRRHLGRILLELMAKLYPGPAKVTVRSGEGKTSSVLVNMRYAEEGTGKELVHAIDPYSYEVAISTGPSYTSQRQEAFEKMTALATAWPKLLDLGGDVVLRNADMPGADQLADRIERALPPELQDKKGKRQTVPPQVQQQLEQGKAVIMQLSQTVHSLQDALDAKSSESSLKLSIAQMQEETKRLQIQAGIEIARLEAGVKSGIAQMRSQVDAAKHSIDAAREDAAAGGGVAAGGD